MISVVSSINSTTTESYLGIDSHAGMSCVGRHARIHAIEEGVTSTVQLFNNAMMPSTKVKTIHVQYAYDIPCGRTYILQVNDCLDFTKSMEHSIIYTNQARAHGTIINNCPKIFDNTSSQSITLKLDHDDRTEKIPLNYQFISSDQSHILTFGILPMKK